MLELFDSHCHLDDPRFDEDREALIAALPSRGVRFVVNCASDIPSSRASVALAAAHAPVYAAVGIHPHEADSADEAAFAALDQLRAQPKVVAVGEIGLDYHYDLSPRPVQRVVFARQIELAAAWGLPFVVHDREAHGDVMDVLHAHKRSLGPFALHCYTGSYEMARQLLDLGAVIAFGGSLTFKNADRLREVAQRLPMDRLLIETDSPYLAPTPFRGKRNQPALVTQVAETLGGLHGLTAAQAARITFDNACRFFGIDPGRT